MADPLKSEASSIPTPYVLSLAERDRRHAAIRQEMKRLGLDVLVLPATTNRWEQSMADARYVTGIGGFQTETFTIFPLDGEPTAYLFNRAPFWRSVNSWITDIRDGRNAWANNLIERLHELDFVNGTIGISQLHGASRTPDGTFPFGTHERLVQEFPRATVVDATEMMLTLRSVKSLEEVAALELAASITDKMIDAIQSQARPGQTERNAYAAAVHTQISEGSETPTLLIIGSGPAVPASQFVPTNRILGVGDLIIGEFEARVGGYGAQIVSPVAVGQPDKSYVATYEVAKNAYEQFLPVFTAGKTVGELRDAYRDIVKEVGGGQYSTEVPSMHGRGLGDETPVLLNARDFTEREEQVLVENMCFILKPGVKNIETNMRASIGRTVHVTNDGAKPLNRRPFDLAIGGN